MIGLIDTHCHLDAKQFEDDLPEVFENGRAACVDAIVTIGMHPESWRRTAEIASTRPHVVRAVGVHPLSVEELWDSECASAIEEAAKASDVVAIGETGLDYYRGADSAFHQLEAFEDHLQLCRDLNLPVVIHQRDAMEDVLVTIAKYAPVCGVMHCFTGTHEQAVRCIDMGLHLGIGGIVTFPSGRDLRDVVNRLPDDALLLETDAPYLAPQPWRGQRNEPAYVRAVAETIAEVRGVPVTDVIRMTSANAESLFGAKMSDALEAGRKLRTA